MAGLEGENFDDESGLPGTPAQLKGHVQDNEGKGKNTR